MGLFDWLKKVKNSGIDFEVETETLKEINSQTQEAKNEEFAPFSMAEFEEINYAKLASILKEKRLLPPSYNKNPTSVKVLLSKRCDPMVDVTFSSTTSDSFRIYRILENEIYESVNGYGFLPNTELLAVWKDFRDKEKYKNQVEQKSEIWKIKEQAKALQKEADRLYYIDEVFDAEINFLKKYKNCRFVSFGEYCDVNYLPCFLIEGDEDVLKDKVTPFTPKTLEFCVSKLTEEAKEYEALYLSEFVDKCRELRVASIYRNYDAWDKTIARLVNVIKVEKSQNDKKDECGKDGDDLQK